MRLLFVRAGALGDVLLLRPALAAVRHAGHVAGLLAPGGPARVLGEEVERTIAWERADVARLLGGDSGVPLASELRSFDRAVAFTRSGALRDTLAAFMPRVDAWDPEPPADRHAAGWLAAAVADMTSAPAAVAPPLVPTDAERAAASALAMRLPQRFLALHPGSGSTIKNWPAARYAALARALAPGIPFLLIRGPADEAACAEVAAAGSHVVADRLSLRVLGALLSAAGLYVGNDSGVTHLAAAYGAPTLALFGPTPAAVWAPIGPSVRALSSPDATMAGLTNDAVGDAAARLRETAG